MTDHPVNGLNDVVHQRVRLGILAVTRQARRVEFTYLRNTLDLTGGNLSQHLTVLENAGLITIDKGYEGKRARTWIQLTRTGKQALSDEIATLKTLINDLETDRPEPAPRRR
jgi:DNA-binding MarR family transcriptional regulator